MEVEPVYSQTKGNPDFLRPDKVIEGIKATIRTQEREAQGWDDNIETTDPPADADPE